MNNQEHITILRRGVDTWNQWRRDSKIAQPDLRGANLAEAQLSEAILIGAQLCEADLHKANLSKADITDPNSIPQELVSIVEQLPSLPVQPILHEGCEPWGMYDHIRRYPWVLNLYRYGLAEDLLAGLREFVILPAEAKVTEIRATMRAI